MEGSDNKRLMSGAEPRHPKKMKAVCPTRGHLPVEVRGLALVTNNPAPWYAPERYNPGLEELTCPPCPQTEKDRWMNALCTKF